MAHSKDGEAEGGGRLASRPVTEAVILFVLFNLQESKILNHPAPPGIPPAVLDYDTSHPFSQHCKGLLCWQEMIDMLVCTTGGHQAGKEGIQQMNSMSKRL